MTTPPKPSEQGFIHIAQELGITLSADDAPIVVAAIHRAYGTGCRDGAAAEREECAAIAADAFYGNAGELNHVIAAAIRARGAA